MNADYIKLAVASYWRFTRQCPLVALEASSSLQPFNNGGQADVLAVTKEGLLIETEVKTSIMDLKRDRKKRRHQDLVRIKRIHGSYTAAGFSRSPTHYFYFAVPLELADKAAEVVAQFFPYAGLIAATGDVATLNLYSSSLHFKRVARGLNKPPLTNGQIERMQFEMSATICRLAFKAEHLAFKAEQLKDGGKT